MSNVVHRIASARLGLVDMLLLSSIIILRNAITMHVGQ